MKVVGVICLLMVVVNIGACSKGEVNSNMLWTPICLVLGIGFLAVKIEE